MNSDDTRAQIQLERHRAQQERRELRLIAGAFSWLVLLTLVVFVSEGLAMLMVLATAGAGLYQALPKPKPAQRSRTSPDAQHPAESRIEFIDRMLAETEHEAKAIAAIQDRNPEIAAEIHDLYRQKLALSEQEVQQ